MWPSPVTGNGGVLTYAGCGECHRTWSAEGQGRMGNIVIEQFFDVNMANIGVIMEFTLT